MEQHYLWIRLKKCSDTLDRLVPELLLREEANRLYILILEKSSGMEQNVMLTWDLLPMEQ